MRSPKRVWSTIVLVILLPVIVHAQVTCEYSCPEKDQTGWELTTSTTAIGYESSYSIFECIYSKMVNDERTQHTCNYYKKDGGHAIGYVRDACPPQAVKCADVNTPRFSAQGKYETPAWIEQGRYMRYLMVHPIPG
ncbi:hypothetical protein AX15_000352 [Amanita polypyramis BW_CC]|nr:hypothetical protein AX15_000352 [Amanita polypyramis BW_CC]